jgi:hypothetical protein
LYSLLSYKFDYLINGFSQWLGDKDTLPERFLSPLDQG